MPGANSNDDSKPELAAEKVFRSRGSTASERLLADLGEQAFLNLWSYPNLFYDKKKNGKGDGKELCDMLVVCGDDLIIFSDKHIRYQTDKRVKIAWPRFYRKAIEEAVVQINGADNWITRYPDKIFTDSSCAQRLPIELPPLGARRVHGVVVATGAHQAIQDQMNDDSGSFMIMPSLKGRDSIDFSQPGFMPFCLGDVNPSGMFIHVFDDVAIKRVLEHLNTITDFTRYLNKRAEYLRTDKLFLAHGEEELLARYLHTGILTGGNYDFEPPRKKGAEPFSVMTVQGEWAEYIMSDAYFAKTLADENSKIWDRLINLFTENVLAGTSVSVLGAQPTVAASERGLRFMAMEGRFGRRMLGESVEGALKAAMEMKQDRYARVIFPTQVSADPKLAYVIMILAYPTDLEAKGGLPGGYEQYRETRAKTLESYCFVLLSENRSLNTAVGIAMDAHSSQTGRRGGSEDMFAMRIDNWTDEMVAQAAEAKKHYDILQEERLIKHNLSRDEFPVLDEKTDDRRKWSKHKPSRMRFKKSK
jgi:hypothetical protein